MTQLFYEPGFKIKLYENCDIFFLLFLHKLQWWDVRDKNKIKKKTLETNRIFNYDIIDINKKILTGHHSSLNDRCGTHG